ncbi:hypothetical protein GOZ78_22150 [Agrobacterium vitis]|uniref:Outer membrane beta-barrel protein n=1 Tax=Agrobacterium vitis TaxID=373 RepID=A0ABD6GGK6_AGRVI|nr:hypothetical protein [Agrobacterium vitis]MUO82289.1 hypothetical protein [Agrobacterium vitis]MUO97556.1 hypothetical protein [Agrobacterium vitis]MUP08076.1 hypothetical protein [Agrobacterium vitis]MUZ85208.1 hypothetical protein [Agrobacterium vitis]MVA12706.1 hypothetical protein [Agrobacterium vitis]
MFYNIILAAGLTLALSLPASAEDKATDLLADREWSVIVSPYVWAASLHGNASLAGLDSNVDIPFSDIFKHLDLAAMGNVEVTNGLFGFYVDGQYVQTSQDEDLADFEVGLKIRTTILAVGAYYRVYDLALGGDTVFGEPRHFTVEPTVGVRWTKLEADADAGFISANKSAAWLDPFVGVRLSADLSERWNLAGEADIGGFDIGSKLAINAQAYLGYRTYMFNHPTILRVGYRVLSQDYETEDFTGNQFRWDVTQHGPVLGFSMRF